MSYTDSDLKKIATMDGLNNECNLMINARGNLYRGTQFKNIPGWLVASIKKVIKSKFLILINPGRIETGLMAGASDQVGITSIVITPEMVGESIGVFTAIESKSLKDRWQPFQKEFLKMVADAGGIAAEHREIVENTKTEYRWYSKLRWKEK